MDGLKRAIVIVMDGCGAGEAPDAAQFGDADHPATVRHVWEAVGGFSAPNLQVCGFLAGCGIDAPSPDSARFGRLRELSRGKDSVTGHWEMMGIVTEHPFPTYPRGFPAKLIAEFEAQIGVGSLGNVAASGTEIIARLGPEHVATGKPIIYTSADSVFQIAAHEAIVSVERLYAMCEAARRICVAPDNVARVIARPFIGDAQAGFVRTGGRRDFPLAPPANLIDEVGPVAGIGAVPELFGGRGFLPTARTQNNAEHAEATFEALGSNASFVFANFEDFDMLYGHRNDPAGFAGALTSFDAFLGDLRARLTDEDLLILTADHGNDPTSASTDHSREFVPVALIGRNVPGRDLGDVDGMTAIGATIAAWLGKSWPTGADLLID